MSTVPFISNVFLMPVIGYGTWQSSGTDLSNGVEEALNNGYRHIDCAAAYENEHIIGDVLQKYLKAGKIRREELFIVSKLPGASNRAEDVKAALDKTLSDLQLDFIDLYLIHIPFGFQKGHGLHPFNPDGTIMMDKTTNHVQIWKEMENLVKSGKTKSIGLSNFNATQIKRILDNSEIKPANLQIEIHLYHQQKELREFCQNNNISVTAYSPLGTRGSKILFTALGDTREFPDLFNQPAVLKLASKYNKTSGQILLRHLLHKDVAVIPKSTSPIHIKENINILDFQLTQDEIKELDLLDQGDRGRLLDFKIFKGIENHPEYPF